MALRSVTRVVAGKATGHGFGSSRVAWNTREEILQAIRDIQSGTFAS